MLGVVHLGLEPASPCLQLGQERTVALHSRRQVPQSLGEDLGPLLGLGSPSRGLRRLGPPDAELLEHGSVGDVACAPSSLGPIERIGRPRQGPVHQGSVEPCSLDPVPDTLHGRVGGLLRNDAIGRSSEGGTGQQRRCQDGRPCPTPTLRNALAPWPASPHGHRCKAYPGSARAAVVNDENFRSPRTVQYDSPALRRRFGPPSGYRRASHPGAGADRLAGFPPSPSP